MAAWALVFQVLSTLRPAFPREISFSWFQVVVVGLIVRLDDEGVTSIVRGVHLGGRAYGSLLKHFERVSCDVTLLTRLWTITVLKTLDRHLYRFNGRLVVVVDSTKGEKSGERMPGTKLLASSKRGPCEARYLKGHHVHVAAAVASFGRFHVAIPLVARLCEGIRLSPNDGVIVRGKMIDIQDELGTLPLSYIVADRFYASANYILAMLERGHEVVCRVKANVVCVDLLEPSPCGGYQQRGRPQMYANKERVAVRASRQTSHSLPCPWDKATMKVASFVAFWKPLKRNVLWVVAWHPSYAAPFIALSTDINLSTHDVLHKLYAPRWSIETAFLFLKEQLAMFMYRFWTSSLGPRKNAKGDLYLHRMDCETKTAILAKVASYDYFLQCALIAQGLLQIVSIQAHSTVRHQVNFYVRTIRGGSRPSEMIVRKVLFTTFTNFLQATRNSSPFAKFLEDAKANEGSGDWAMAA